MKMELIAEYLFMLYSLNCIPYEIPKYISMYPYDIHDKRLTSECLKLRCFIFNTMNQDKMRTRIESAITLYNIQSIEELINYFANENKDDIVLALKDVTISSSMCSNCNKYDWSDYNGKRNS